MTGMPKDSHGRRGDRAGFWTPYGSKLSFYFLGGCTSIYIYIAAWGQAANKRKAEGKPKAKAKQKRTKPETPESVPDASEQDEAEWPEEEWPF